MKPVSIEQLQALSSMAAEKSESAVQRNAGDKHTTGRLDVEAYLRHYGREVVRVVEKPGYTLYVIAECVFDSSHRGKEAGIGQKDDGTLFYQCFHDSCQKCTWHDAREKISGIDKLEKFIPGSDDRRQQSGKQSRKKGKEGAGAEEEKGPTQAQLLIELAQAAVLFHTPDDAIFAHFGVNGHKEFWLIRSKGFKRWISHRFYESQGKPPGAQAIADALNVLEAKGQFDGPEIPVFIRIAEHDGNVYIDLTNASWEAIEITPAGWQVVANPPVKFRRSKGMLPLPHPIKGGSLNDLKPFINIPNEDGWKLLIGWLIKSARPAGPYPILNLEGEQGSAKSSTSRIVRSLIDPSTAPIRTVPRDERDMVLAANNGWIICYDNLSGLPVWLSDALCRLSTGGGFSTRELYSNDEETIFDAMRPVILNGIDQIANRHDLADRSIILNLPAIPEGKRLPEKELWNRFEAVRPKILGALCDGISEALRNIHHTTLPKLPRMADFALWVCSAEGCLPWKQGGFIEAYQKNRKEAVELSLEADPVGCAVRQFMASRNKWEGTATELLGLLKSFVPEDTQKTQSWPKRANALSRRLKRNATFLRAVGIQVGYKKDEGTDRTRYIVLDKICNLSSESSISSEASEKPHECYIYHRTIKNQISSEADLISSETSEMDEAEVF